MCLEVLLYALVHYCPLCWKEKFKNDHFTVDFVGEAKKDPMVFKRVVMVKYSYFP